MEVIGKNNIAFSRFKRHVLTHVKLVRGIAFLAFTATLIVCGFFLYRAVSQSMVGRYFSLGKDFLIPRAERIVTNDGRINILVLGKGGAGHDAPDLTDTMMFVSISILQKDVRIVSIPRDIWVPSLKDKVNSAYNWGKLKENSQAGIALAKSVVGDIVGQPVAYGVVVDFGGFKDAIDAMGGIDVNVKNGFSDTQYPITGRENDTCNGDKTFACRYMTVTFNAGQQYMDGERALAFVRSRHASGVEGNDIAREARQQLIVAGMVKKALDAKVFLSIGVDIKLLKVAQNDIETDMKLNEAATVARYLVDGRANIKSYTIPDSLLYNPPNEYLYHNSIFTHAFVFIPNNQKSITRGEFDWSDVHAWVKGIF